MTSASLCRALIAADLPIRKTPLGKTYPPPPAPEGEPP